jgi:uncharacterized protein (TIGR03118 family)
MKHIFQKIIRLSFTSAIIISGLLLILISSCQKEIKQTEQATEPEVAKAPKLLKDFTQVNLIGDNDEFSPARVDPNLVNGWGIAFSSGGTAWVSAEGTGVSLVVNKDGGQVRTPVAIPSPAPGSTSGGHPSGQVFNGTPNFGLANGSKALFIFAGLDGVISAWNGAAGNSALAVINSPGSVFAGIAIAQDNGTPFLYAANFSQHKISVYDTDFVAVNKPFVDSNIPDEYSPFNIQNIGGKLYVMYAKFDEEEGEEETGPGLGYVDIFNPDGSLVKRFVSKGQLNAPWGVAWAPASFFGDDGQPAILIGNFGDGHINAYREDGAYLGQLRAHGKPIEIEGLWAITFAPSTATTISPDWLYFAAGPGDEEHGLFGYITK